MDCVSGTANFGHRLRGEACAGNCARDYLIYPENSLYETLPWSTMV